MLTGLVLRVKVFRILLYFQWEEMVRTWFPCLSYAHQGINRIQGDDVRTVLFFPSGKNFGEIAQLVEQLHGMQ